MRISFPHIHMWRKPQGWQEFIDIPAESINWGAIQIIYISLNMHE